ncbi:M15 family metallopeptidase [uncultured Phascolarctobacterium sp.]|uniref:M15 family metallopeptidase n=1 Tax=uncultured Phascolarctobacterium sp. TaxID=512296 RepID=UPI002604EE92|nr:M15 family metallopeptidase [uncultured Phascolarctobacterium sp.]
MFYRKMLTGLAAGLLLCVQASFVSVCAAVPNDTPKDIKHILGFYYGNGENILIRENGGNLELLYRFAQKDKDFSGAIIYPLAKEHFDAYLLNEAGPMSGSEANVRFERDPDGYGISCRVGGHIYSRYFVGRTTGERAKEFRFPEHSAEEWAAMRKEANEAVMPEFLRAGQQAELVDAATVAGLQIDSRYGAADNCFGAPLYSSEKLFVGSEAAQALAKVQQHLAAYGYGLVLWDAYRPWSVSKLANLALPTDKKQLLEDPETKGSAHNTGNAVDVSLYDLASGEQVEMISDFDEPSMRQFASYAGGTSRQRYLRNLLKESMELYGFKGIEMEWWHFDYQPSTNWAHLNVPMP